MKPDTEAGERPNDVEAEALSATARESLEAFGEQRLRELDAELEALRDVTPEEEYTRALVAKAVELFVVRCMLEDAESGSVPAHEAHQPLSEAKAEDDLSGLDLGKLKDEYNIEYPERYPRQVLEEMLEDESRKPWGLVVVAKSDHNGAFARTPQLAALQGDLGDEVAIRIVEAENDDEAAGLVDRLGEKYGECEFGICLAHGSETGFQLGEGEEGAVRGKESEEEVTTAAESVRQSAGRQEGDTDEDSEPTIDRSLEKFGSAFMRNSKARASLVLVSCSTGKGGNPIAKQMAKVIRRKVMAPDEDSNVEAYNATLGGSGVELAPTYDSAERREFD